MRIDVKSEQRKFWEIFDEKLIENGEPFSILYEKGGEVTYWAVVNKKQSFVDNALSIDFLVREQKLRINIYVRTDLTLFSIFERNRKDIETMVGMSYYDEVIDKALPVVDKMKKVCEVYARNNFFDF